MFHARPLEPGHRCQRSRHENPPSFHGPLCSTNIPCGARLMWLCAAHWQRHRLDDRWIHQRRRIPRYQHRDTGGHLPVAATRGLRPTTCMDERVVERAHSDDARFMAWSKRMIYRHVGGGSLSSLTPSTSTLSNATILSAIEHACLQIWARSGSDQGGAKECITWRLEAIDASPL